MSGLTDYLNLIVEKLGEILKTFNQFDFPEKTIKKINEAIVIMEDCKNDFPNMSIELKDTLIDFSDILIKYKSNIKKGFVESKKEFIVLCQEKFGDPLEESNWTKFTGFKKLRRLII